MQTLTFNELRRIKNRLPDGSIRQIAAELELSEDTVRNYFGGLNHSTGNKCGIHIEPGPDGGIVLLDDSTILDKALFILGETNYRVAPVMVNA
jgi:transcriptional antiterminator